MWTEDRAHQPQLPSQSAPSTYWCLWLFLSRCRTLHVPLLNSVRFLSDHFSIQLRSLWMADSTLWCITQLLTVMYLQQFVEVTLSHHLGHSWGYLTVGVASKNWGEEGIKHLVLLHDFCHQFSFHPHFPYTSFCCWDNWRKSSCCPSCPLPGWTLAFLTPILHAQTQSVILLGHLTLLPHLVCFLFMQVSTTMMSCLHFLTGVHTLGMGPIPKLLVSGSHICFSCQPNPLLPRLTVGSHFLSFVIPSLKPYSWVHPTWWQRCFCTT